MLAKAMDLPADEVFIDLEDSVAPNLRNDETRSQVVAALRAGDWTAPTRVVRVNSVGTPWCLDDLVYVVGGAGDSLDCVMVPKVETAAQIHFVNEVLADLERKHSLQSAIGLEVQIESPLGLVNIESIAAASPRIETLIFGPGDYAAAAGMPHLTVGAVDPVYPGDHWHFQLARIVTTARAFGLQAIDGPFAAISDLEGFATVARRSRALGFDGKWALHPSQISPLNDIYTPTAAEVERAQQILAAYERSIDDDQRGALMVGSEMVDEASRKMAESVLSRAVSPTSEGR